jgi:NADH-quinone oxidoreductase subunit I
VADVTDRPARSRGIIALLEQNCTSCMICARECPDWCIHISSHTETEVPTGSGRPREVTVLDRFAIDYGQCMYCGICIEVCPFDALHWAPDEGYPGRGPDGNGATAELVHERPRLGAEVASVPPPPTLDPAAEAPPEAGGRT